MELKLKGELIKWSRKVEMVEKVFKIPRMLLE